MRIGRCLALVLFLAVGLWGACEKSDKSSGPESGMVNPVWFRQRTLEYIRMSTESISPGSLTNAIAHMGRETIDPDYIAPAGSVGPNDWDNHFDKIGALRDTSDFNLLDIIYANLAYPNHPFVDPAVWEKSEKAMLEFKYWFTDPTPEGKEDDMWYWTENHQVGFHTCEYLAGQLHPDKTFLVTGRTGRDHQEIARNRLLAWFETVRRFGFREWHSNVYYSVQFNPLLALAEFAEEEDIRTLASMTLDLMLFDLSMHTYKGAFGVTHGRTYKKDKMSALDEGTFELTKLLFDTTAYDYPHGNDSEVVKISVGSGYRPPQLLIDIAQSDKTFIDQERINLPLDESISPIDVPDPEGPYGVSFTDPKDQMIWWGASVQTAWQVLPATLETFNQYNLWENDLLSDLAALRPLIGNDFEVAQELVYNLTPFMNFGVLSEIHSYTYRTAHYMLNASQDYRKGFRQWQNHSWQATLDPNAQVFTTHPGHDPLETDNWRTDGTPGQWTGTATQPRSGQFENVAIHIYSPHYLSVNISPLDIVTGYVPYTHAYFPQDHFDEVEHRPADVGSWTFGRLGEGYVALWSHRSAEFITYDPAKIAVRDLKLPFELRAEGGADNVWIVEMGDAELWESFAKFKEAISGAAITVQRSNTSPVDALAPTSELPKLFERVEYDSPSQGAMVFGWELPLTVSGEEKPLRQPMRFDNPWSQTEFDATVYEVKHPDQDYGFRLDFSIPERKVWP